MRVFRPDIARKKLNNLRKPRIVPIIDNFKVNEKTFEHNDKHIKLIGIPDFPSEDLIYDLSIGELGDFDTTKDRIFFEFDSYKYRQLVSKVDQ